MKKLIFLVALLVSGAAGGSFAQTDSTRIRNAFGSTMHLGHSSWNTHGISTSTQLKPRLEGGLIWWHFLNDELFLQTGFEMNERRSTRQVAGAAQQVYESFAQVPVSVMCHLPMSNATGSKRHAELAFGGGLSVAALQRQGFADPGEEKYAVKDRQFGYLKAGWQAEVAVYLMPSRPEVKVAHVFGIRRSDDIRQTALKTTSAVRSFANYSTTSLYYAVLFRRK